MHSLETRCHRGTGVTTGIHDVLAVVVVGVVQESLDARLSEAPSTGVERLLLGPDDGLGVRVHVEVLLELLPGEGVELLNAGEGNVVDLVVRTVLVESGPDLTRAEDHTVDLLRGLDGTSLMLGIRDDPLELRILPGELLNVGAGERVTQESLGEEDDES